jgi:hypothetical protein
MSESEDQLSVSQQQSDSLSVRSIEDSAVDMMGSLPNITAEDTSDVRVGHYEMDEPLPIPNFKKP